MKICPHCGKGFDPVGRQKFCTYACTSASYEANRRAKESPEKKKRRIEQAKDWKRKNAGRIKAYNDKYTKTMKDYYIVHLLRNSGIEPTPENIAKRKMFLKIKRKMRAANKRRNNRNF